MQREVASKCVYSFFSFFFLFFFFFFLCDLPKTEVSLKLLRILGV